MAKGNGELRMLDALKAVGDKLDGLRSDVKTEIGLMRADLNARLDNVRVDLNTRLDNVRADLNTRLDNVSSRLDRVIENTGTHWRGLDARVKAIEEKLGIS
ncbi:MAG: hypothetical protein HYZ28_25360 [Myxococcales bacterium]|nr:hypothetical protein [Myxococcales bacterium]